MKKIIIFLLVLVLIVGCRTSKKIAETSSETSKKMELAQAIETKSDIKVANDKKVVTTTVITETNYFPPDTTITKADEPKKQGATKSTIVTVVTETETDQGITEDKSIIQTNTDINQAENTEVKASNTEEKTNPVRWGWIFGILVSLTGLFFYVKNSPVGVTIKALLTKIFKQP